MFDSFVVLLQARRALRALRGLVRLKSLMESSTVKRQASNTLRCMQTLARVQSQIHFRRVRMLEENQALQKQLLQKHAKDLESLRVSSITILLFVFILTTMNPKNESFITFVQSVIKISH